MTIDDKTRIELEAAVFRRVVSHLRSRTDVQNIETMDLTGFCRNCLASWMLSGIETVLCIRPAFALGVGHDRARRTMRTGPVHPHPASPSTAVRGQVRSIRCKGQAASMLAEKQLPTPQKQSTHSEAPEQTALWVAKPTHRVGVPKSPNSLPVGHWRYVPRPCIVAVTQIDRWAGFEGGNDEFETN
jgi:hypothetical protein